MCSSDWVSVARTEKGAHIHNKHKQTAQTLGTQALNQSHNLLLLSNSQEMKGETEMKHILKFESSEIFEEHRTFIWNLPSAGE